VKYLLCIILLLIVSGTLSGQESEPVVPVINHQTTIEEPNEVTRSETRNTNFGVSMAKSSDLLVIGAPSEFIEGSGHNHPGAVYIYRFNNGQWTLEQKLVNPFTQETGLSAFGSSVAIQDGILAIASRGYGVYFYTFNGIEWSQSDLVEDNDTNDWDGYGTKMALEGNSLAVSDVETGGAYVVGKVHLYRNIANVWTHEITLTGDINADSDFERFFGTGIAFNEDASVIAIGEPEQLRTNNMSPEGAVYIYAFNGTSWELETTLIEPLAGGFGFSLDMIGTEANTILAVGDTGAYSEEPLIDLSGNAYIYSRSSNWGRIHRFSAPEEIVFDQFGYSVELIGTPLDSALIVVSLPQRHAAIPLATARFYIFNVITGAQIGEVISPSETDFDNDGQIDSDGFGREIITDGIGSSLEIIVSATGKFEGQARVFLYGHNPNPAELVNSGDFENSSRDLILNAWNRTPGAKLRCGRGVDASCGVKFKSGINAKITQSVDLSQFPILPGDGLLFQMDVKVKGASAIKAKLKVFYSDGFSAVVPLRVENTGGVFRTVMTAPAIFIANRPLDRIVISIKHTWLGGAAFLDNVSLVRVAGSAAR
jgi:hypothetical protein